MLEANCYRFTRATMYGVSCDATWSQTAFKERLGVTIEQLSDFEPFAIVKLTPEKGVRIVERITIAPATKEKQEERQPVEIFTKQLSENGLNKIWPQEPLEKGEYAVIECTEGKFNAQIWDFRIE